MARETITKILQDPSLKEHKRGIVVKMIFPYAIDKQRDYMIVLLNDKSKLYGNYNLFVEFAVNLAGEASTCAWVSVGSCVKPTVQDYLELWEMYTRCKKNGEKHGVGKRNNSENITRPIIKGT